MMLRRRSKEQASVDTTEATPGDSTETSKKKGIPRIAIVLLLVVVVLGGGYFGLKTFVLKPKSDETVASTTDTTSAPTGMDAEAGETTTAAAPATSASPADDGSKTGTVVRAGSYKCGVNKSHVFMVAFPEGEKEVRLAGVGSFHFGPITQEADNRADALMRGKRVSVVPASEDFFRITGSATLADGRDMAEVLAAAGLVQQEDGASEAVRKACDAAQDAKKGIYALLK